MRIVGIASHGDFRGIELDDLDEETGSWECISNDPAISLDCYCLLGPAFTDALGEIAGMIGDASRVVNLGPALQLGKWEIARQRSAVVEKLVTSAVHKDAPIPRWRRPARHRDGVNAHVRRAIGGQRVVECGRLMQGIGAAQYSRKIARARCGAIRM